MDFMKFVPKWLLIVVVFYLMVLVAWSVFRGSKVSFWPPYIFPNTVVVDVGAVENFSSKDSMSFVGTLDDGNRVKVHLFSLDAGTTIVIQPKDTTHATLYFDLSLQKPSGEVTTVQRIKSTDASGPLPFTSTKSGVHFLVVSKRDDADPNLGGPYFLEATKK